MSASSFNKRRKTGKPNFHCIGCYEPINDKEQVLYCNFDECENLLCNTCIESNDFSYRDSLFSECFSCICDEDNDSKTKEFSINFYYCKDHAIYCKNKHDNAEEYKFCFGSICKPCQAKDPNWAFKKCDKCLKYLCCKCIIYCGAQECEKTYCSDCVQQCEQCKCKLCPVTKETITISGELHVCFDDYIVNLMKYIQNDIPDLGDLLELLKEVAANNNDEEDFTDNICWVESETYFEEGNIFAYSNDANELEFTNLEEIKEVLNILLDHKLNRIIQEANGNFSYFFGKIQHALGSTKNILLLITQMLFMGEITIDDRITTISNEIIKQEQLIALSFDKECCSVLLNE